MDLDEFVIRVEDFTGAILTDTRKDDKRIRLREESELFCVGHSGRVEKKCRIYK